MARARSVAEPPPPIPPAVSHAALLEYLASGAVSELVITSAGPGGYRLEAALSWRSGRSMLVAARGGVRTFRSLDTLAGFLRSAAIGTTIVRLELGP